MEISKFLLKYHLPIGLLIGTLIGFLIPAPGVFLSQFPLSRICVGLIFLCSGLKLETSEIKKALTAVKSSAFGIIFSLLISPCIAFLLLTFPPLDPPELMTGLIIFCCLPTTVTSGVVLTGSAIGNVPLALLLSVSTNLLGVLTVPAVLSIVFANMKGGIKLDPWPLLIKMVINILIPLAVGKSARELITPVPKLVKENKTFLKLFSSFCLLLIPFMEISKSADQLSELSALSILYTALIVCLVLGIWLIVCNLICVFILRISIAEQKAVVMMSCSKTLAVGVTVIDLLPSELVTNKGLILIPCMIFHFIQMISFAFIAAQWSKYGVVEEKEDSETRKITTTSSSSSSGAEENHEEASDKLSSDEGDVEITIMKEGLIETTTALTVE